MSRIYLLADVPITLAWEVRCCFARGGRRVRRAETEREKNQFPKFDKDNPSRATLDNPQKPAVLSIVLGALVFSSFPLGTLVVLPTNPSSQSYSPLYVTEGLTPKVLLSIASITL